LSVGDELPYGWIWASVGTVATLRVSDVPSGSNLVYQRRGAELFVIRETSEKLLEADVQTTLEPKFLLMPVGTILVAVHSDLSSRSVVIATADIALTARKNIVGVVPSRHIYPAYLAYCLAAARQKLLQESLKDTQQARKISFLALSSQRLLVPPHDAQRRIVARIRNDFYGREAEAYRDSSLQALEGGKVREKCDSSGQDVGGAMAKNWQYLLDEDGWLEKTLFDELARQMKQDFGKPRPKSGDDWPLEVGVERNEATLHGVTHHLDDRDILILDVLNEARGHPVTRRKMREAHALLKDEEHLDRVIKKIPPPFCDLIQSSEEGYWIDPTSLE